MKIPFCITAATLLFSASSAFAVVMPNLVTNGDFSSGDAGFTTDYRLFQNAPTAAGNYAVLSNPVTTNASFYPIGDHTSGTGNMLILDGARTANQRIWAEALAVEMNTTYSFSGWFTTLVSASPARIQFSVNGVSTSPAFALAGTDGMWNEYTATWFSGANSTANLRLVDLNTSASGNDFAIDDLRFAVLSSPAAVSEPVSIALVCLGLLAFAASGRKKILFKRD